MEFNLEEITKDVKNTLSEKRYIHCIGVMEQAAYLAKKYGYDIDIARVVGIAHDIAKEIPEEEKLKYVEQNNIEIDKIESVNIGLLHAKIGADICKKKYNFTEEMQNAIKYHTTGDENMNILAKIIFVADKTEKNRKYEDLKTCLLYTSDAADE